MIDSLFGSKTRIKLLHLFLNNPNKSFYVREITRLIDEQINSVRRELANMLSIGIIVSDNLDNKLYYEVCQEYEHYQPLRQIFANKISQKSKSAIDPKETWREELATIPGARLIVTAGVLVKGSASHVDLLLVGNLDSKRIASVVKKIEKSKKRVINYTSMTYDDFYYRLSVRDKFISDIISGCYDVLLDAENILKQEEK